MLSARLMYAKVVRTLGGRDGRPDSGYTIDQHPGGFAVAAEVRSSRRDTALGFHRSAGYSAAGRYADGLAQRCCGVAGTARNFPTPSCVCSGYSSLAFRSFAGET